MQDLKKFFLAISFAFSFFIAEGQHTPLNPTSYRIFNPFMFNPALAGSKDYSSLNLLAAIQNKAASHLLTGDTRVPKKQPSYFGAASVKQFSNIGVGGGLFNDLNGYSRNIGLSTAVAYHLPVNLRALSFFSFGIAAKAVHNSLKLPSTGEPNIYLPADETIFFNLDLGICYYGSNFYFGLSATNLFGNPNDIDSITFTDIPVSHQIFVHTGYKFLVHREMEIVIEPSLIVNTDNNGFEEITEIVHPLLKVYLKDFCLGSYYKNSNCNTFFFQYRYPGFYLGAYFEIPKNSVFYINKPVIELTAGINLARKKYGRTGQSKW